MNKHTNTGPGYMNKHTNTGPGYMNKHTNMGPGYTNKHMNTGPGYMNKHTAAKPIVLYVYVDMTKCACELLNFSDQRVHCCLVELNLTML